MRPNRKRKKSVRPKLALVIANNVKRKRSSVITITILVQVPIIIGVLETNKVNGKRKEMRRKENGITFKTITTATTYDE